MKNLLSALGNNLLKDLGYSLFEDGNGVLSLYKAPLKNPVIVTDDEEFMFDCLGGLLSPVIGHA